MPNNKPASPPPAHLANHLTIYLYWWEGSLVWDHRWNPTYRWHVDHKELYRCVPSPGSDRYGWVRDAFKNRLTQRWLFK